MRSASRSRPVHTRPVKVPRLSNPNRLPSPLPPSPGGSPVPPRVRPRLGPAHDVPFVRRAGPPHGGSSLRARSTRDPRLFRPSDLLDPTSPDDFCNLSRPADTPANPDPRLQFSRHSCECRPPQDGRAPRTAGGGRVPANRGGRALQPTPIHRNHPSTLRRRPALSRTGSGPRSLSGRPRPRLPHRGANHDVKRRDQVPSLTSHPRRFSVGGLGPRSGALEGRPIPASAFVTTRNANLDGLYVLEWLGRWGVGSAPHHHPADRSAPVSSATGRLAVPR